MPSFMTLNFYYMHPAPCFSTSLLLLYLSPPLPLPCSQSTPLPHTHIHTLWAVKCPSSAAVELSVQELVKIKEMMQLRENKMMREKRRGGTGGWGVVEES